MKNYVKISKIYYLSAILVCLIFTLGYFGVLNGTTLSAVLIQIISMLIVPFLAYTLFVSKSPQTTLIDCGIKSISLKVVGITLILGIALYFLNSYVATLFSTLISFTGWENIYSKFTPSITIKFSYLYFFKEIILTAIFPAICEEFIHRGILLHASKKYVNTKYCLIISSLLFGCMHMNIQQFFYTSILGCVIGIITLSAGSIIPGMIVHFLNNFLSTYFYYGRILGWKIPTMYDNTLSALTNNTLFYLLTMVTFIIVLLVIVTYLIKMLKQENAKQTVSKIIQNLNLSTSPIEEIQARIDTANQILSQKTIIEPTKQKLNLQAKVFTISTFVLTGLVTLSTFIWGLI